MGDASWKTCSTSVRRTLKRFLDKTFENLSSMKFYVLVTASVLLWMDKLGGDYWLYTMMVCIGTRNLVELASVFKDLKTQSHVAVPPQQPSSTGGKDGV